MTLEMTAVGGFSEIGRQSTAIKVDNDVFIIDLGLHVENYMKYTQDEREDVTLSSVRSLRKAGAVPDWTSIRDWKSKVRAIIITHAHLDHVGAVPYMAHLFGCPIYASPFTLALLRQLVKDKNISLDNELIPVRGRIKLTDKVTLEFITSTHSTVDTNFTALHTPYGVVFVDNDYKLDKHPTLGPKPDFKGLKKLRGKVKLHVGECLYAPHPASTPSESVARQMLQDLLLNGNFKNRPVFVSTFASHIARLNTLIAIGQAMQRKVVFMGRSMSKYLFAAKEVGIIDIPKHVRILRFGSQLNNFLRKNRDLSNYLLICTGHFGEPKAVLSRIADGKLPYRFKPDDVVVLSSHVIPVETIIESRKVLNNKLRSLKVRIYADVHVSGHASREDIRWMLETLRPEHLCPNHGNREMTASAVQLADEVGIPRKNIHVLQDGDRLTL